MVNLRFAFCFVILFLIDNSMASRAVRVMSSMAEAFQAHGVVPDVVPMVPDDLATITINYDSGVEVNSGNELTPTQVRSPPRVNWPHKPDKYYTFVMTDPDAPSRMEPIFREWNHWLIGNIPGDQINQSQVLLPYTGSAPSMDTGLHRYVFLVYEQPDTLTFTEAVLTDTSGENRGNFKTAEFAMKYNLGAPVAGNLYQAQYEDYVPILYKQLGE